MSESISRNKEISILTLIAASHDQPDQLEAVLEEFPLDQLSPEARQKADQIIGATNATPTPEESEVSDVLNWAASNRRLVSKRVRK